ncbi:hypothetical protein GJV44_00643 [Candidatus Vallotia cooleyia]|nr:hypothetical protein GJV44_00643 [Candidatus Vallotia cooleyia]
MLTYVVSRDSSLSLSINNSTMLVQHRSYEVIPKGQKILVAM